MSGELEILRNNREALLLAEVAAWLHDMGKCDDRHIIEVSSDRAKTTGYQYRAHHKSLVAPYRLSVLGETVSLSDLVEKGTTEFALEKHKAEPWLVRTLARCHSAAHIEKEERYLLVTQKVADTRPGNAFGCEKQPVNGLEALLTGIPFNKLLNRSLIKESIRKAFNQALGDTRRPDNEVTLWDWGSAVAALYKGAVAAALLGNKCDDPKNIKWRLLSIRYDGYEALFRASRLPDLLVRQKILQDGLNRVKKLLEVTYPLGTEVYQDNCGSLFVVCDIGDLLLCKNSHGKSLKALIEEVFSEGTISLNAKLQLDKEIVPQIILDYEPWIAEPLKSSGHSEKLPPVAFHLNQPLVYASGISMAHEYWNGRKSDICSVCQIRPQGWGGENYEIHFDRESRGLDCPQGCRTCKAIERKVCSICEERREDRSINWARMLDTTIWIDEVADDNGRVAIVAGGFDLMRWENGQSMFYPENQGENKSDQMAIPLKIYEIEVFDSALAEGQILNLSRDDYRLHLSEGTLISNKPMEKLLSPFRRDKLRVACSTHPECEVEIAGIEKLSDGNLSLRLKGHLAGGIDGDLCKAMGAEFKVAENGQGLVTNEEQAIEKVKKVVLYDGLFVKKQIGDCFQMKNALTFTRQKRVWTTIREFWKSIISDLAKSEIVGKIAPRLRIKVEPASAQNTLGVSHSYELKVENLRLSIVCVKDGEFLTAENLLRFAKLLSAPEEYQKDYCTAAMYVRDRLSGKAFEIEEPTGYGSTNKQQGEITITEVTPEATPYVPAIPILAEPRTFMALVPADRALAVVEAIKEKYEAEMGKVRNRLPLTVGVVFAGSRTPLAALLDSGRRMLNIISEEEDWKISSIADEAQHRVLNFEIADKSDNPALKRKVAWRVPVKMGDGVTDDQWYPYFFTDAALGTYHRMFRSPDGERYLVHVGDLRDDDSEEIKVQPSFFDFEFLHSAAQRFEVSYKDGKRRSKERQARPYYLEELDDFNELWKMLSEGLTTTQIKQLNELIEAKRREWFNELEIANEEPHCIFRRFVEDALNNAGWKKERHPKDKEEFEYLLQATLRGQLADVIELNMQILKLKSKVDRKDSK